MPTDWREALELGVGMMDYYLEWLKGRDPLATYVENGIPQVEVYIEFPIPFTLFEDSPFDEVRYRVTFDRVVIDEHGRLWILDYKTAIRYEVRHFETDGQISAYSWVGSIAYDKPIAGFIYQQHRKVIPDDPRILQSGLVSTNKQQLTTSRLYENTLKNLYGEVKKAPAENIRFLNDMHMQETEDRDAFIRRDRIERNPHRQAAEGTKVLLELEDMLNPELPLYPNPTRDCSWCQFQLPCVAMDDGDDWEHFLEEHTHEKAEEDESWRQHLNLPDRPKAQYKLEWDPGPLSLR
jgi:hypothetical protein